MNIWSLSDIQTWAEGERLYISIFIDYFKWENWTENLSKWGRISFRFTIIDIVHELVRLNHFKPEQRQTMSYSSLSFYILAPSVPTCYRSIAFHGFIEELIVNDDPEYQVFPRKFLLVKLCLIIVSKRGWFGSLAKVIVLCCCSLWTHCIVQ